MAIMQEKKQNHLFEIKCTFSGILCMIKSQHCGPNKSLLLHGEANISKHLKIDEEAQLRIICVALGQFCSFDEFVT